MKFSSHVREAREKAHVSTQKLADDLGVSRSYISLIENGKRLPSKKLLKKLAEILNVNMETVSAWYLEEISSLINK